MEGERGNLSEDYMGVGLVIFFSRLIGNLCEAEMSQQFVPLCLYVAIIYQ